MGFSQVWHVVLLIVGPYQPFLPIFLVTQFGVSLPKPFYPMLLVCFNSTTS